MSQTRSIKNSEMSLFARKVIHGNGIFEERIIASDHGDPAVGDEITGAIGFRVVANRRAFREMDVAVDDAAAYAAMASYGNMRKKDAVVDFRIRVHAHIR